MRRAAFNCTVYVAALLLLNVSVFKIAIVAASLAVLYTAKYGYRWIDRIGFGLILIAMSAWVAPDVGRNLTNATAIALSKSISCLQTASIERRSP